MGNRAKNEEPEEEADPEVCFQNRMMLLQKEGEGTEREEEEVTVSRSASKFLFAPSGFPLSERLAWNRLSV